MRLSHALVCESSSSQRLLVLVVWILAGGGLGEWVHARPPTNDACIDARVVGLGSVNGSNIEATSDLPESGCALIPDPLDVWYSFTAPVTGRYTFDTLRTDDNDQLSDTTLAVYSDCLGTQLGCNDNANDFIFFSIVRLELTAGQIVLVRVSAYGDSSTFGSQGTFTLTISGGLPPTNDDCTGAIPLTLNTPVSGSNEHANDNAFIFAGLCGGFAGSGGGADVFFTFTPAESAEYRISSCESNYISPAVLQNTVLSLHSACPASDSNLIACSDDGATNCFLRASLEAIPMTAGVTYHIRLAGNTEPDTDRGDYTIVVRPAVARPPAPPNDTCNSAIAISSFPYSAAVAVGGATNDGDTQCNSPIASGTGGGIWYSFNVGGPSYLLFAERSGAIATCSVYSGGCGSPTEVACVTDDDTVNLLAVSGSGQRRLMIGRWDGQRPQADAMFDIELDVYPLVAMTNDACATARTISTLPFSESVEAISATDDPDVSCNAPTQTVSTRGVWYRYVALADATLEISEESGLGTGFESYSMISVWIGSCAGLTPAVCSDRIEEGVRVAVKAGEIVHFMVARFDDDGPIGNDPYLVKVVSRPAVANDRCSMALSAPTLPYSSIVDTSSADDIGLGVEDCANSGVNSDYMPRSIWYAYTSPAGGPVAVRSETVDGFPTVGVYTGGCGAPMSVACDVPPVFFTAQPGETYLIGVADFGGMGGVNTTMITAEAPVLGACCGFDGSCVLTRQGFCDGRHLGDNTVCRPTACCPGDFNESNSVEVADIFAFLNAWFSQFNVCVSGCTADVDQNGAVEVADIFAFLNQWFSQFGTPCPS